MKQLLLLTSICLILWSCEDNQSTQAQEAQELEVLFAQIESLSTSVPCENASSWTFTGYGHKACGGPIGYIAYSMQIDTEDFLQKVAIHASKQREFNEKWGVISDCALQEPPSGIVCESGIPVFI